MPSRKTNPTGIFRSKFESRVASELKHSGVPFAFEPDSVSYIQPEKRRRYTPDFVLPNGVILEAKGLLTVEDRMKHLWIQDQFPMLDIRFVFQNPYNKLTPTSRTTYAAWAMKHGFKWCYGPRIPTEWITETLSSRKLTSLAKLVDQATP